MFEKIPDILTLKECMQLLKIGRNSMLNFLHSGELEGFKIGNRWRIYVTVKYPAPHKISDPARNQHPCRVKFIHRH